MSEEWCKSLHAAALNCNQYSVLQLLEEIPENHQIFKHQLEDFAENYQFDKSSIKFIT